MLLVERETGWDLPDLLRELYHERGLTLAAISRRLGVPVPTVAAWMARFELSRAALARRALESMADQSLEQARAAVAARRMQ